MLPVPAICFLKDMVGVFYTWFNLRFMQMEFQDKLMLVGKKLKCKHVFVLIPILNCVFAYLRERRNFLSVDSLPQVPARAGVGLG